MKFVDVRNDIAFKKIFGSENKKGILISFLNSVLNLTGDRAIDDITILNPWQAPDIPSLKETILDIRAVDKRKITFIVEIQIQKRQGFQKRVLYYTSKAYVDQLDKGEDYYNLKQVIFIGIVDFNIFEGSNYLTRHLILNTENLRQELKDLEFNFIELPKFTKNENQIESVIDKWIYFIKNAASMQIIPKSADFVEIKEAYEIATEMQWDKEELRVYEYWQIRSWDEMGAFLQGKVDGELKGKIEGLLKGIDGMLDIKYAGEGRALMDRVRSIETVERLEEFQELIKRSTYVEDLKGFLE
ncbi:MAG: Rpn family recombination-promoting nuclease/putative transposase [Magnetococcales bacterium]|nr:Rpn family recombination-promoting nuclease/putative transposase [Nitrospirota bacterium]